MKFIEEIEILEWCGESGIPVTGGHTIEVNRGHLVLQQAFGQAGSSPGNEVLVAERCLETLGLWDECLLWVQGWGIWPSSENWPAYYAARGAAGDRRSLEVGPGHLFVALESKQLLTFIQLVLENAWDAQVIATYRKVPNRQILISHDEWVEIWESGTSSVACGAV